MTQKVSGGRWVHWKVTESFKVTSLTTVAKLVYSEFITIVYYTLPFSISDVVSFSRLI